MKRLVIGVILVVLAFWLAGCAPLTVVDLAYTHPTGPRTMEAIAQDRSACFRAAQALPPGERPIVTDPGFLGTGGDVAIFLGHAAVAELELARRFPPDPATFEACMIRAGYWVEWKGGARP